MKKIGFIVSLLLLMFFGFRYNVAATSVTDVYVVYEKNSYQKGEVVNISIDIKAFANLFETIIRYNYDDQLLEVIENNDGYFYLNNHSIFSNFIVNKKFNQNVIYAEMLKETLDEGFYSSYKNNLCKISFNALGDIVDIRECFAGLQIYLFDNNHTIIEHSLKFQEKIKTNWKMESLEVEIGNELPDINEMFEVTNRKSGEYLAFIEEELDLNEVSEQVLQIGVYDLITGYYQTYSKIVKIKDLTKPIISGSNEIIINDFELDGYEFLKAVNVVDNYDLNPKGYVVYYDDELEISYYDAIAVIKEKQELNVGYYAVDSSFNQSELFKVLFKLKDTTSPKISGESILNIKDVLLDEFILEDHFSITDNLDQNPKLVMTIYNSEGIVINSLLEGLSVDKYCIVKTFGVDVSGNQSEELEVMVNLIDTTKPVVVGELVTMIDDKDIDGIDFIDLITISDNDPRACLVVCKYNNDTNLSLDDFKTLLKLGETGYIEYKVFDYSNNLTIFNMEITVNDTTRPVIKVNIENNGLYKVLDEIIWEVSDNFNDEVVVNVYIDNQPYDVSLLTEGKHNLFIEAIDNAGNVGNLNYHFVISDDSFVENLINGNVKLKTSTYLIVIIILSAFVVVIKILVNSFRKKKL